MSYKTCAVVWMDDVGLWHFLRPALSSLDFSNSLCVGECSQIKPFYVSTEQLSAVVNHIPDRKFGGKTLFGAFSINELIIKVDEFGRVCLKKKTI